MTLMHQINKPIQDDHLNAAESSQQSLVDLIVQRKDNAVNVEVV